MECKKCGAQLQNDDTFCAACGEDCINKEKEAVKCNECGKFFNKEFGMCPFCGTELAEHIFEGGDNECVVSTATDFEVVATNTTENQLADASVFEGQNETTNYKESCHLVLCHICNNYYDANLGPCKCCQQQSTQVEESDDNIKDGDSSDRFQNAAMEEKDTDEKKNNNYKAIGIIAAIICIIVVLCIIFSNAGSKGVSMKQIKKDIGELSVVKNGVIESEYTPFTPYTVDSVEIEKRQTNIDDKEDIVYCNVVISNEYYQTDLQIKLMYSYYDDGGWIRDNASTIDSSTIPIGPINKECVDSINVELNGKQVELTSKNIKSISFDESMNLSIINYEYADKFFVATGNVEILFKENQWEKIDRKKFVLDQLNINWSSDIFISSISGDNGYWSYLHTGATKTQAIGTLYYVNESEKGRRNAYYQLTMPIIDYNLSITKISNKNLKIFGTLNLNSDTNNGYSCIQNKDEKIAFECNFNANDGSFEIKKTLNILAYRSNGYMEPFKDPQYTKVDFSFKIKYNFKNNEWQIYKFNVDKIDVGNYLLCTWTQYEDNIYAANHKY